MEFASALTHGDDDYAELTSLHEKEEASNLSDKDFLICGSSSWSDESTLTTSMGLSEQDLYSLSDTLSDADGDCELGSTARSDTGSCDIADHDIQESSWEYDTADSDIEESSWEGLPGHSDLASYAYEFEAPLKQLRGARRTQKALRRYLRPQLVHPSLLTAAEPWPLITEKDHQEYMQRAGHEEEDEATRKKKNEPQVRPFQKLQDSFKTHVASELHRAFGPGAVISPTSVSQEVEARFMRRFLRNSYKDRAATSLLLGFHGTQKRNFTPIFKRGFLLPGGKGGVAIANGNAHGAGIYTAREGAANLSKNFCDSNSMLVCGIVDDVDQPYQDEDQDEKYDQMLRIGRTRKRPSAWHRVSLHITPQVAPRILGNHQVHRETREVRHVGDAMVIFNPSCVVPLFQVDHVPKCLYQKGWRMPSYKQEKQPETQTVNFKKLAAFWPREGNPNILSKKEHQANVAPPSQHERHVKRRVVHRQRQRARQQARQAKFVQMSLTNF